MDVISAVTAAGALINSAYIIGSKLYRFIDGVRQIDDNASLLKTELETLSASVSTVNDSLRQPGLDPHERHPIWQNLTERIEACQKTVTAFGERCEGLLTRSSPVQDLVREFKMEFRQADITRLRAQIQSHTSAMQMMMLVVVVHISSHTRSATIRQNVQLNQQNRRLGELITALRRVDLNRNLTSEDRESRPIIAANAMLRTTAEDVVSSASTVAGSETTIRGDLDTFDDPNEQDMSRSVAGEPLTRNGFARVQTWISDSNSASNHGESTPGSPRMRSSPRIAPNGSMHDELDTLVDSAYEEPPDDDANADLLRNYVTIGKERLANAEFEDAERFFLKALAHTEAEGTAIDPMRVMDIRLSLAEAYLRQGKLQETKNTTGPLVDSDIGTSQQATASYLHAQSLFALGDLTAAKQHCKRTFEARKRLTGRDPPYYAAVSLMVAIFSHEQDEVEAAAYARMIPADFRRPTFRPPRAPSSRNVAQPAAPGRASSVLSNPDLESPSEFLGRHGFSLRKGNVTSVQNKAMLWAAHDGRTDVMEHLLSKNISVHCFADLQEPSEPKSMFRGFRTRKAQQTADVFNQGITPLHAACGNRQLGSVKRLLEAGADPSAVAMNPVGALPIHYAVRAGEASIVECLLQYGTDPNARRAGGVTALMDAASQDRLSVMRVLIEKGAVPDRLDLVQSSALDHACAGRASPNTVAFLIRHGLSAQTLDTHMKSPLHCAAKSGNDQVVDLLIQHHADLWALDDQGHLPLHVAAWFGHQKVISKLLDNGASIDAKTRYGDTALHLAAHEGRFEAATVLVQRGADTTIKGRDKMTAEGAAGGNVAGLLKSARQNGLPSYKPKKWYGEVSL